MVNLNSYIMNVCRCFREMRDEYIENVERVEKQRVLNEKRAEILKVIYQFLSDTDPSPLRYEFPVDLFVARDRALAKVRKWHEEKRTELVEAAIDVAAHRPKDVQLYMDAEEWCDCVTEIVGEWARLNPELWAEEAGPLLEDETKRHAILSLIYWSGSAATHFKPWLMPFVENPSLLSKDEKISLVDAIGDGGADENVMPLLLQLERRVYGEEVKEEINIYKRAIECHKSKV